MPPTDRTPDAARAATQRRPWHELLRALRETGGSTQEGWAARLGVSRKTVQRWEKGERAPDPGAETAILAYCRGAGLLRAFDRGPLAGLTLTEDGLRDLFGEARWRGDATGAEAAEAVPPTNLPMQLTSFVGREQELAAVRRVQAGTRLLTLTGPGGCGKTRLALALAGELLPAYPDGVWFVDLAPLADPALTPQAIASVLEMRATGQQPLNEALAGVLRARHLLLIVDNCEHLLPACAELVELLLRACRHLEVVATSRESLGVPGETIWRVPPMAVPDRTQVDAQAPAASSDLEPADAMRLFVERARLRRPEFAPDLVDTSVVAEICRRLDGMPLAIELAAARVDVLSVAQIAERLHDRFALLTSSGRATLRRHQTLRAAMDWSYELLTAAEQALLGALSVFAGGFTLEAAEAVCGAGSNDSRTTVPAAEVLDLLTRLVDKSLVFAEEHGGGVRYRLLQVVSEYGAEKLAEAGDDVAARGRHFSWCLALAQTAACEMFGPREVAWLARLEQEHDNLRAALGWSLAQGQREGVSALRLAGALPRFWELRGHLDEGRRWLSQALAAGAQAPAAERAAALRGAGILAYTQGDLAAAYALFERCLLLYREIGDRQGTAEARGNLGRTALRQGDHAAARALLEQSLALYANLGYQPGLANVQFTLGVIALRQGEYGAAEQRFRASLALHRRVGNREGIANALEDLVTVLDEQGRAGQQEALLDESLALYRELGDRSGVAAVLGHLGMEAWAHGDYDRAQTLLEQGLALYREVGDRRGAARLLGNQSLVAHYRRDVDGAAALCRESLALYLEAGDIWALGRYLPVLAAAVFGQGAPEQAVRLFALASALRARLGAPLPPVVLPGHDRAVAELRATLGESAFTAAWREGAAMSPAAAIDPISAR